MRQERLELGRQRGRLAPESGELGLALFRGQIERLIHERDELGHLRARAL